MTQKGWSDSNYRGVAMQKMFKKLQKRAQRYNKSDNPEDDERLLKLIYGMDKITNTLSGLAKNEEIEHLKQDLAELKRVMGIAQTTKISK